MSYEKKIYPAKNYYAFFEAYEIAAANFHIRLQEIKDAGLLLRHASLEYDIDYDTKIGKWKVFVRWFPVNTSQLGTSEENPTRFN